MHLTGYPSIFPIPESEPAGYMNSIEVGAHENSDSPYGTFDMGGNVAEWTETSNNVYYRWVRGGSFADDYMASSDRLDYTWTLFHRQLGFRVASVPAPATVLLFGLGGLALMRKHRA